MVRPPLDLEQELRDHRHHGKSREHAHVLWGHVRDVEDARDEDVDFAVDGGTRVGVFGETVPEDAVGRAPVLGAYQVEAGVVAYEDLLESLLGVCCCEDDDVDVLRGPSGSCITHGVRKTRYG